MKRFGKKYRAYMMLPRTIAVSITWSSFAQSIPLRDESDNSSSDFASNLRFWRSEFLLIVPKNIVIGSVKMKTQKLGIRCSDVTDDGAWHYSRW